MIISISISNKPMLWPVIFVGILLLGVFLWKEFRSSGRNRMVPRILAVIAAVLSLALMVLKPLSEVSFSGKQAILLTSGHDEQQLDSLKKKFRGIDVLNYKIGLQDTDLNDLSKLYILGNGVEPYDLYRFGKVPVVYLPGPEIKGVVKLQADKEGRIGDEFNVKGRYDLADKGQLLVLKAPGGQVLDSVELSDDTQQIFELRASLKTAGDLLYSLEVRDSIGDVLSMEPLPISVNKVRPLKILILNASPGFETRYLKNFLADAGNSVIVRSRVSTGRFKFEFLNSEKFPVNRLNSKILEETDLLILDESALKELTKQELDVLKNEISLSGLGVFIQTEVDFIPLRDDFWTFNTNRDNKDKIQLSEQQPAISISKKSFQFTASFGLEPLVVSGSEILYAYKRKGKGRIGTGLAENTYELLLNGNKGVYERLWTGIINKLSKRRESAAGWQAGLNSYKDEPFEFELRSHPVPPVVHAGSSEDHNVPLIRDEVIRTLWKGVTHPRQSGWNRLEFSNDSLNPLKYYVYNDHEWLSLKSKRNTELNKAYFKSTAETSEVLHDKRPISAIWFFLIFIFSIGFLWLEPKL